MKEEQLQLSEEISEDPIEILQKENFKIKQELVSLKTRSLSVFEENNQLKASPELAREMAQMKFDLQRADYFIQSGAFVKSIENAAQAYVILVAGREMGMKEMESIQSLSIVNGRLMLHSKALPGYFTGQGYRISFTNESRSGLTVTMKKGDWIEEYEVKRDEEILQKSTAMTFASKNKMRFHGIRQIVNFHLAHLFTSVGIWDDDDMQSAEKRAGIYEPEIVFTDEQINEVVSHLEEIWEVQDLVSYYNTLDKKMKSDQKILDAFGGRKQELRKIEDQKQLS